VQIFFSGLLRLLISAKIVATISFSALTVSVISTDLSSLFTEYLDKILTNLDHPHVKE